ncbi:MAG TPA: hypothetical protein VMV94_18755 [Phycisphaerae bacterium]|nr:hypothetical protein [Phycisphaerae bacterium]
MRKAFLDFLVAENILAAAQLENLGGVLRGAREPIGSIAFSFGMITGSDIDVVLDEQRRDYRPFGEIAMEMGMLTRHQVEVLLRVQEMRGATETAEALALSGICSIEEVTAQLGRFFSRQATTPLCA